ncbi:low molecular weight protein-tyrosine-phosphatase [Streptomyces sp. NPDC086091]|uniref:low molecular weight protein-tyrosine-phosphatase n=1 Tax=Streptomyces sp. NPDC086091 TaxID=3365751 RepID=UPI00380679AD
MVYRVCFVCTGNICRSPMAEAVFRARVTDAGLDGLVEIDSAGTGAWHVGEDADPRTLSVLAENGYTLTHAARVFERSWFARLDLVLALDGGHLRDLRRLAPTDEDARKVRLLGSYGPAGADGPDVPDPYYGGREGFEECLQRVEEASAGLLAAVRDHVEGPDRRPGPAGRAAAEGHTA